MRTQFAPDIAKAIGIFLVVLGHVLRGLMNAGIIKDSAAWSTLDNLIYLFHMPLFFFLSGLFFEETILRRGYIGLLKNNFFALLLPLVIWSYVQFGLQYVASGSANVKLTFNDVLTAPFPPRQQFWFLWTLFVVAALTGAVMQVRPWRLLLGTVGLICVGLNLTGLGDISSSMPGSTVIRFAPYFILGVLGGASVGSSLKVGNTIAILVFIISIFVYGESKNNYEYIRFITSIVCIFAVYKVCLNLSKNTYSFVYVLTFVGMNSMIIYLAHVIFAAAFRSILMKFGIMDITMHLVGGTLFGIVLPLGVIPIGLYFGKISPKIFGSIFPARIHRSNSSVGVGRVI
jgi:fucose 4-O-acetylase-like acetyltransferase